jgi:hypothetical protein
MSLSWNENVQQRIIFINGILFLKFNFSNLIYSKIQ